MCPETEVFVLTQAAAFPPGGFADVFLTDQRAFKLYKNHHHPQVPPERSEFEDELRRLAFHAERKAYEIASNKDELKKHIPKYYGVREVSRVVGQDGKDISGHYLLDCCLELQRLQGESQKFAKLRERFGFVEKLFQEAGILHTTDMSGFVSADGGSVRAIDFATSNAYTDTETRWILEGEIE